MKSLFLLAAAFLAADSAYAACSTSSRNLHFYDGGSDVNYSSSRVLSQCQQSPYTSNYECAQNLRCDYYQPNPYPSGQVSCSANSRGLYFQHSSSDVNIAARSVISQCQANPYTSNAECTNTLTCSDAGWGGGGGGSHYTSCSTYSRGLSFNRSGDINSASTGVVQECMANPYTSNSECQANLSCSGSGGSGPSPYPPYPQPPRPPRPQPPIPQPPIPQPPRPQPQPPGGREIMCVVTTQRTSYSGTGFSEGQATAAARSACLGSETSFVCNAASVVCRSVVAR